MNNVVGINRIFLVLFFAVVFSQSALNVWAYKANQLSLKSNSLPVKAEVLIAPLKSRVLANNYYQRRHKDEVDYRNPSKYNNNVAKGQGYGNPVGPSIIMPVGRRYLKRPAGINPKASSYYNQGLVKYGQGRIDDSITWMKKAVAVDPRVPKAQYNIGVLLFNQGKFAEAKWWFTRVLRSNPGDTNASHWLSMCSQEKALPINSAQDRSGNRLVNPNYSRRSQAADNRNRISQKNYLQRRQMVTKDFGSDGNQLDTRRTDTAKTQIPVNVATSVPNNQQPAPARNIVPMPPNRVFGNSVLNRQTPSTPPVKPAVNKTVTHVVPPAATRATDAPVKDKWALIIGISNFQRPEYNLAYSAKDARDFYDFLVNEANFRKDHVKLLIDQQATRANIMGAFGSSWLPRVTEPGDLVVVYVSTHGTPADVDNGGRNYIVAYDTDANDLYPTGVDMDEIYRRIKAGVKTDRALIVLDTCYSGSAVAGARALVRSTNFDLSKIQLGSGHLVISSSSPGEKSWESKRYKNGIFTHRLIEALRQKNKLIDVKSAFKELKSKVSWEVKCDRKKSQIPQLGGNWKGAGLVIAAPATSPRSLSN